MKIIVLKLIQKTLRGKPSFINDKTKDSENNFFILIIPFLTTYFENLFYKEYTFDKC